MLEKYLSSILVPYLSKFAENFDAKQLNVDLWNGNVVLKDLVLKPSVLEALLQGDSMSDSGGRTPVVSASPTDGGVDVKGASVGAHLPITMQRGICRRINFVVPYTQLRSKPVVMEVGELFISLKGNASNRDVVLSKVAKLDAQAAYKERELEQFEAERRRLKESNNNTSSSGTAADSTNASGATGSQSAGSAAAGKGSASSDGKEGSGYFSRLSEIVINNLVIKVQSVHIRYEDEITKTVMGAILGDVRLFTIDSVTGEAKFVDAADMKRIPKRLEFSGLQFYCDDPALYEHGQQQLFTKITDVSSWLVAMRSRVEAGDLELSTVIGPVSGHVDVNLILKNFVKEMLLEPYMIVRMRLDCFAAKFNRAQYLSFVRAVSLLSNWTGLTECLPPRPKVTVVGNATVWWRYATNAVRAIIGAPRRERLLKRISEVFIVDYHILYRDVVRKVEMSPEKQRAYRFITRFMTVPDMIAGRKYVYAQLANAIQLKRKDNEAKKAEAAVASKSKKKTWFSWSRGTSTTTQPELSEEDLAIIELERAYGIEPSDKVGEDVEASGEENKLPDSYCWLDAQFELPMLSASLGLSKTENVELMLHNVSFLVRKFNAANSLQLRFVTNNLTLSNPVKDDELLSRLPSLVEGLSFRPAEASCSTVNSCTERQSRHGSNAYSEIPLLECSAAFCPFEQPIEDTQLDFMMDIRLLPLRIVADPPTIDSIVRFFQVPKGLNLTAIVCHTKSIAATVGQVASTELRLAMSNTKSYKISLDASAPHIILPKSLRGSVDEPTLAVSLGRAKFDTQPLTETEKRRRIELLHNGDASEDWLYYSSRAIFSQFYVELAPLNSVLDDPGSGFMLVPEVAFSADVLQRIDDDTSASREQLIVRMEVPKLCMACSLSQAHILSSMVERWLLYLGAEEQLCDEDAQPSSSLESTVFNPDNIMSGATTGLAGVAACGTSGSTSTGAAAHETQYLTSSQSSVSRLRVPRAADSDTDEPFSTTATLTCAALAREDQPYVRLHVTVRELGINIFEDDANTRQPLTTPRFKMAFSTAVIILHIRTVQQRLEMLLKKPYCLDTMDPNHLILEADVIHCNAETSVEPPVRVSIVLEPSLTFQFGTPCIQLLESIVDILNLIATTPAVMAPRGSHGDASAACASSLKRLTGGTVTDASLSAEQTEQIKLVEELCSMPDTPLVEVSLHIAGTAKVVLMDRRAGQHNAKKSEGAEEAADFPVAYATFTEVTIRLKKNRVTLEASGCVQEVMISLSDVHDVSLANRVVMRYRALAPPQPFELTSVSGRMSNTISSAANVAVGGVSSLPPSAQRAVSIDEHPSNRRSSREPEDQQAQQRGHVTFSYHTSRPVMPIFQANVDGKRQLMNASELRFSSFVDMEMSSSAVILDVYSILTLSEYFRNGLFSKVTMLSTRPRYDGRVPVMTPLFQAPQLLMSVRVFARDLTFVLPIDARSDNRGDCFRVSVDHVTVQSSLLSAEEKQSMNISLREIRLLRDSIGDSVEEVESPLSEESRQQVLMPTTSLDVSLKSALDPFSDSPLRVELCGDKLVFALTEDDVVDVCRLISGNLTRMPATPPPAAPPVAFTVFADDLPPDSGSNAAAPPITRVRDVTGGVVRPIHVLWRAGNVCLSMLDKGSGSERFRLECKGVSLHQIMPSGELCLRWERFELHDVYEEVCRAMMMLCDSGRVELRNITTTQNVLKKNFIPRASGEHDDRKNNADSITSDPTLNLSVNSEMSALFYHKHPQDSKLAQTLPAVDPLNELLEVPTLILDFTLERFAVSDQWLAVYDFVWNEAVVAALKPMLDRNATGCVSEATQSRSNTAEHCFRCTVTTRSVIVPFLTTSREEFIEADITSLLVDVVTIGQTTSLSLQMHDLIVRHCASGERILFKKSESDDIPQEATEYEDEEHMAAGVDIPINQCNSAVALPVTLSASTPCDNAGCDPFTVQEKDIVTNILDLWCLHDGSVAKPVQKITLAVGELAALMSSPLLAQIVDYCSGPDQPIAKISNLGVMRERREWLARAAGAMVNNGALSLQLLWHQPRIIFAGDALDLTNKSRNIEASLGFMRSMVHYDKCSGSCTVSTKVTGVSIPEMLEETTLYLKLKLQERKANVSVVLDRTMALVHPAGVEKLLWVLQRNLMLPVDGKVNAAECQAKKAEKEEDPVPGAGCQLTEAVQTDDHVLSEPRGAACDGDVKAGGELKPEELPIARTVCFKTSGVILTMHDILGINVHTASFSDLHVEMSPSGDVDMTLRSLTVVEHFTNKPLVETRGDGVLTLRMSSAEKTTSVDLGDMNFMLVPKAIGSLLNMLLSVQFPSPLPSAEAQAANCSPLSSGRASSQLAAPAVFSTTGVELASRFVAKLNYSCVVAILGDRNVFMAEFYESTLDLQTFVDTSSTLTTSVGWMTVRDTFSSSTQYSEIVKPMCDRNDSDACVLELSLVRYPSRVEHSEDECKVCCCALPPSYTQHFRCHLTSLTIVFIPDVSYAAMNVITDIQGNMSDVNRGKAYDYVADKTAQTLQERVELMKVEVAIDRSRIILVDSSESTNTIEVFPGDFFIQNKLSCETVFYADDTVDAAVGETSAEGKAGVCGTDASASTSIHREVFSMNINRMSLNVLGTSAFSHSDRINLSLSRFVGECSPKDKAKSSVTSSLAVPGLTRLETTCVTISVPVLSSKLTQAQLNYILDVMGAFRCLGTEGHSYGEGAAILASSTSQVASAYQDGAGSVFGGGTPMTASFPTCTTGRKRAHDASQCLQGLNGVGTGLLASGEAQPGAIGCNSNRNGGIGSAKKDRPLSFTARLQRLETNIDDKFDLVIDSLDVSCATGSGNISYTETGSHSVTYPSSTVATKLSLDAIVLRHHNPKNNHAKRKGINEADDHRGYSSMECQSYPFFMNCVSITSKSVTNAEGSTSRTETSTTIVLNRAHTTITPLMLTDVREVLYGPFCAKVFRVPLSPIPVYKLTDSVHVLNSDLTLDASHILVTASKTRCCYTLDLNQYKLYLTGYPSAQLALEDNCQLTITNGCVVVPGMYSLSSFVSFGANASLFTSRSCIVEKHSPIDHVDTSLPRISKGRSRGGMESSVGSMSKLMSISPMETHKPQLLSSSLLQPQLGATSLNSTLTSTKNQVTPVPVPTTDNELLTLVNLRCNELSLFVLAEDVEDIGIRVNMSPSCHYKQRVENGLAKERTLCLDLKDIHTGVREEVLLLNTDLNISVVGIDTICVTGTFESLGMCLRVSLLRSLVELGKDIAAALTSKSDVQLNAPAVTLENEYLQPLVAVKAVGECRICGCSSASIAESRGECGVLCYRCCTGKSTLPETTVRAEIQQLDVLFLGDRGGMLQLRLPNSTKVTFSAEQGVSFHVRMQLRNLNQSAAVWEPLVERFEANVVANIQTSSFKLDVDKLDYVVSPENVRLLKELAEDFSPTSELQRQLRRKGWASAEPPSRNLVTVESRNRGHGSVAVGAVDEDEEGVEGRHTLPEEQCPVPEVCEMPCSLVGGQESVKDCVSNNFTAHIIFENLFSDPVEFEGMTADPCGGILKFHTTKHYGVLRCEVNKDAAATSGGITINWVRPPLYVRGPDVMVEVKVQLTCRKQDNQISRIVRLRCFPIHSSSMIICFRNNVTSPIEVIQGRPAVPPHGQLYFNRDFPLDEPLQLRPLKMGDERYSTVVTAATLSTPTLRGLLNTPTTMLQFKSNQKKTNLFAVKATVKQEAFRAGIPMFIIALEPQIFIENHLPYNLHVYIHTDSSKHKGCTSTELGSLFLEPSQSEGVMLGETNVEQALFHIELHQKAEHGAFVPYCTSTSFSLTRRSTVLTLKSTIDDSQMSVIARYADHKVTLSTPYSIVNFSPLDMEVRECTESGALVQPKNMNFNLLPGSMQTAYAAAPNDVDSKEFFVTVTVSSFTSAAVPLHLQDRGTIILELRDSAKLSNHKKGGRSRGDDVGENNVLQFMYSTQIDMYGSRFVTIVPRWIIVNRTPRPLYIVQAVLEPSSGQVTGCSGTRGTKGSSTSPLFASTSSKSSVRSERRFQCRVDLAQLSPPNSATPLFVTQKNSAEVGYAVFVLQSKDAVVHGDPVSLEEIASTLVLAHGSSGVAYTEGSNILVETSVVVDGPYTFFTLQEPAVPPFILLNRTLLSLALYNAYGQLLAQVEPGCITPFVVDARDRTSRTQVCLASECATASTDTEARCESRRSERPSSPFAEFNFNQHMTPEEANNPLDIEFVVNLGSFGQQIIELNHISGWRAPVLDHDDSISTNLASPEQERNLARSGSCGLVDCGLYCYRSAPPASFDAMVILSQLSVSLVTTDREIIFGVIDNVSVHLSRHGTKEILKLSVKNLQLDNQCELNPVYEVCCMAIRSSLEVPCFSLYVERTVVPAPAVLFVDEVRLDIVPIAVRLSDNILAAVGTFVSQLITDTSVRHTALTEQELFDSAPMTVGAMNTHVILERMVVNPLIAHLWFERDDGRNLIREHVRRRTAVLISMIPSCENVQVSMPGLAIERRVGSADALLRWLLQAYVTNLRRQIYELLFQYASSLPLLGAPIRLVSGVGSGALRFFHDPISGLTTSPKAFAMGFASGSSALLTEVVSGGLGAVSNLAKTGADIMDAVANNSRRSARSKGSGVNLFRGIASAVSGVVTKPLEGAVESGAKGLVRGMGYGLLGVVANPVAGLLSDVSRVTSTAAQLCDDSYVPSVKRMRKLRDFHASGAVADFQSVISVYEHERGEYNGSRWVSSDAWLPTDGPKWHPHKLDQMRHPQGGTIQTESWQIAYYGANFEGWKFGKKYHGVYAADTVSSAHLRRRRWVAVMYALPPSYLLHLVPQFVEDGPSIYASPGASTVACLPTPMLADRQPGERSLPAAHGTVTGAATETSGEKPMGTQSDSLPGSDEVVVKLYQYESKVPFFGWSTRFLPADCAGWQDSEGRPAPRRADYPLPSGWSWVDEWNVVGKGMENEYEYLSMAVPKAFKLRRRCWTRTMRKTS